MTICWISKPKHQCWIKTTISTLVKVIVNAISKSLPIWKDTGKPPVCCGLSNTAKKQTVLEGANTHSGGSKVWQGQGRQPLPVVHTIKKPTNFTISEYESLVQTSLIEFDDRFRNCHEKSQRQQMYEQFLIRVIGSLITYWIKADL